MDGVGRIGRPEFEKGQKKAEYPPFWTYYNVLDVLENTRFFRVQEAVGSNPATRTKNSPKSIDFGEFL